MGKTATLNNSQALSDQNLTRQNRKKKIKKNILLFQSSYATRYTHEARSSTGNPVDLPFCFELTDKGYTLLKHRELLACVVDGNSFETAWFLKERQP